MTTTNGAVNTAKKVRGPKPATQRQEAPRLPVGPEVLAGVRLPTRRVSIDAASDNAVGSARNGRLLHTMAPPQYGEIEWRWLDLDSQALRKISPSELLDKLPDISPEVGKGLWDFLRLCNPGWECKARSFDKDQPDERAQAVLDAFWGEMNTLYGSADIPINRLFLGAFLRGSFCAEMVLEDGRMGVDLATPDPFSIRFARERAPGARRLQWTPLQYQGTKREPVRLDVPTFRYVPVDPMPASPYGRPIATTAVFAAIFLLSLFHDLKRVIQQQGYPRIDVSIELEKLATMAPDLAGNAAAYGPWVTGIIEQVENVMASLQPEDTYVHTDVVTVNKPVGAVDGASLDGVGRIIESLERMLVRALKTIPLQMVTSGGGASESDANRQWELQAAGIKSLQHLCENLLAHLLGVMLQAAGAPARVLFSFSELRSAEEMRDEQTRKLKNDNIAFEYQQGWRSQDEASMLSVGHLPEEQEPRPPIVVPGVGPNGQGRPSGAPADKGKLPEGADHEPEPSSKR